MSQLHILVVDDDPDILLLFQMVGRRLGHRISLAASSEDALRVLDSENPPNAVLVDLDLRVTSGEDLCSTILHRLGSSVRVFLMTADPLALNGGGLGCAKAVITKPFDVEEVIKLISSEQ